MAGTGPADMVAFGTVIVSIAAVAGTMAGGRSVVRTSSTSASYKREVTP